MRSISDEVKGYLGDKDWRFRLGVLFVPPSYYASSIEDFISTKSDVKAGANLLQAWSKEGFFLNMARIMISEVKYMGRDESGYIGLEDVTGKLSLPAFREADFQACMQDYSIGYRQTVKALLQYEPRRDMAWVWKLEGIQLPAKDQQYNAKPYPMPA